MAWQRRCPGGSPAREYTDSLHQRPFHHRQVLDYLGEGTFRATALLQFDPVPFCPFRYRAV